MRDEIYSSLIESALDRFLPACDTRPSAHSRAIRWAVEGGGKRIRPRICLAAAESVGGNAQVAINAAVAIELLHSYTLVHDDLPAMDNDRIRRGKPSVWAEFGEAEAILAGDALQALAFSAAAASPCNAAKITAELAKAAVGVVAGQVEDIGVSNRDVDYIYEHKTADLFMAAAVMGGLAADADENACASLREYAFNIGMAFQFEDDLLDGDSPFSKEETRQKITMHTERAKSALTGLPGDVSYLSSIADFLVSRKS